MLKLVMAGTITAAIVAVVLWTASSDANAQIEHTNAAMIAEGEVIYQDLCASCHGADLEGQADWKTRGADGKLPAPPHDATGHTWHHPGEQLFQITKYGTAALIGGGYQSEMRGFAEDLTDAQIWAVLSYIKSRWPAEVISAHNDIEARNR